jgi:DNA-binding PucR family transcriptional regulator
VVKLLAAPAGSDIAVDGVVIYDATDPPPLARGNLVLAVGWLAGAELSRLMERVAHDEAVLVVKASTAAEPALREGAERIGLTLVSVAHGATWMQIASLLRSAMRDDAVAREDEHLAGIAAGDLFALANAVAALIDAPVTIEDPQSRVIAFSSRQDEADEARMATVLGRRVPDEYYRKLQDQGVFRSLYRSKTAIYVDDIAPDVLPRIAVAVRAGDELLGSIWAAVHKKPSREKLEEFAEAANFVALHLLRHRIASDVQRELQAELVSLVLNGGTLAADAAGRLNLSGDGYRVLSVALQQPESADDGGALLRCWDMLALHLSVLHRRAASALVEGAVYAIIPLPKDRETTRRMARQAAEGFLTRLPDPLRKQIVLAIGGHAAGLNDVPRSRQDADRILRLLREREMDGSVRIATIEDVRMEVLLLRLAEVGEDDLVPDDGPLSALVQHDSQHGTRYVETLAAYLEAFGDIGRAASRLGVHHNTFRYRLQKLQELPGVSLDDPSQRLALQLQLRLMAGRKAVAGLGRDNNG